MNNSRKHILLLIISLLLCAPLLAACGGDNPSTAPSATSTAALPTSTSGSAASFPTATSDNPAFPPTSSAAVLPATATAVAIDLPTNAPAPAPTDTTGGALPTDTAAPDPTAIPQPTIHPLGTPTTLQSGLSVAEVEQGAKTGRYFIYDVSAGDTLANVATAFALDVTTLAQLNNLDVNAPLTTGRTLLVQASLAGDFSFMPNDSIVAAVRGDKLPRVLAPGTDILQAYNFRLALHRVKLAMPASGATDPGYILVFYTVKDSIVGQRGTEDVSIVDPAFVVAGGSLVSQVNPNGGVDSYATTANGVPELVKTYRGALGSAQDLYNQLVTAQNGGNGIAPLPSLPTATPAASGQQPGLSTAQVEQGAKTGRYFIYDVSAGDTIANIAPAFGLDASQIATLNKLDVNAPLTAGRTLLVQTTAPGDLAFMPNSSIATALQRDGFPRVLFPGGTTLQQYNFRIALHRVKMTLPQSGGQTASYVFVFYTVKDSIIGGRGNEDVTIIDPAFAVAGGPLAKTISASGGTDFYATTANGIDEVVKTYKGAQSSAQSLWQQLVTENQQ